MPGEPHRLVGWREGQVVVPSERVLQRLGIDIRGFGLGASELTPVRVISDDDFYDEWGVLWQKAGTDAPAMPGRPPFQHLDDPVPADLDDHPWPLADDPGRARGLREKIAQARETTDYALVLNLPNSTFALSQRLRGFTELFEDLILNEAFAEALQDRVTTIICGWAESALKEVGDLVDAVSFADDMGIQTGAYMSPDLYKRLVQPHHARLVESIKRHTKAKVLMHSDGAIYELLPHIIEAGVEVINPVQVNAEGMDPDRLKREFGRDLSFWGGVDTQKVLPYGSPADVVAEVRRRLTDLGRGGGYVLASVHNIQAEVPAENLVAMYETALAGY
jgi:uroporphyrinogen decarboxylase